MDFHSFKNRQQANISKFDFTARLTNTDTYNVCISSILHILWFIKKTWKEETAEENLTLKYF